MKYECDQSWQKGIDWLVPIGPKERSAYVIECLQSIYSQISVSDDGLIVVCDVDQWGRYPRPPEGLDFMLVDPPALKNASAFRNAGLSLIKRPYVIFHDSDDVSMRYRRSFVLSALGMSDVVCSGYFIIDEFGVEIGQRNLYGNNDIFFFRNNVPLPTLAIRTELLDGLRFNESLVMGEDNELIGRILKRGVKVTRLEDPLIKYRIVPSKHGYRSGVTGITNELKYRIAMARYSKGKRLVLLAAGALVCVLVKSLPGSFFSVLYRRSHGG